MFSVKREVFVSSMISGIFLFMFVSNSFALCNADHDLGLDTIGILKTNDRNVEIKELASGLKLPTHFTFLDKGDILVLEKNNGTVRRIINGDLLREPLLDVNVATIGEKGMLGIAVSRNPDHTYVFLYFTEAESFDGGKVLGNRLYRYDLRDNKLTDAKLLLNLPAMPGPYHYGGALVIGSDGFVYLSVGDLYGSCEEHFNASCPITGTQAQNYVQGADADGRAGILRITQDGKTATGRGILGNNSPLDKYYAYGIRNSFGIDFDPLTGKLWDTENGPDWGDEINLVEPGFNSGWRSQQGLWTVIERDKKGELGSEASQNLVDFDGMGKYSSPEFTWNQSIGPSAIKFLNTDKYGEKYKNDMFVADSNYGRIYHFKLTGNRNEILLKEPLHDKIANNENENKNIVFAEGFGLITDMQIDPDGYLYILTYGSGKIFMLVPRAK